MNNTKNSFGILITAVFFVISQPLHAAAFNSDTLDFHSAFIEGPVNPHESLILQGVFRNTSSTRVGEFVSAYIQLSPPTVSGGPLDGISSFYQLDNSTTQKYKSNLEAKLRMLAGNQSITLPIAKLDPMRPQDSAGLSFEIDIVRLVVNGGLVTNPDGSFSTSVSLLPAGDLPATFSVATCELDSAGFKKSIQNEIENNVTMTAEFRPSNGCTLDEVAAAMGYDHFNWVQVINHYDGKLVNYDGRVIHWPPIKYQTPLIDPPQGGYLGDTEDEIDLFKRTADNLPYYWDEETGLESGSYLEDNIEDEVDLENHTVLFGRILRFRDTPRSNGIDQADEFMSFTTSLVGVVRGNAWVPEFTFKWKSNYNGDTGSVSLGRDISPPNGGHGGIFDVQILDDPLAVDIETKYLWVKNGFFDSIPQEVEIEVKPGSNQNCINTKSKGVIPVAVLGSGEFDVTNINAEKLVFGGLSVSMHKDGRPICAFEDVNNDSIWDLVCQFDSDDEFISVDGNALLGGELFDGSGIAATDSICILPM